MANRKYYKLVGLIAAFIILSVGGYVFNWYYGLENLTVIISPEIEQQRTINILNKTSEAIPVETALSPEEKELPEPTQEKNTTEESGAADTITESVKYLSSEVFINVPFTSQAPYGDWADPRQQDGCEEASLLMAQYWLSGEWLNKAIALKEILAAADWQEKNMGSDPSLSVDDTIKLARDYFKILNITVEREPSIDKIRQALDSGKIVLTPVNGQALNNPHFTAPGPPEHMVVIIGYDDNTQEFITNDPGTRVGKSYHNYMLFLCPIPIADVRAL